VKPTDRPQLARNLDDARRIRASNIRSARLCRRCGAPRPTRGQRQLGGLCRACASKND
jgi:hypothetical protein